MLASHLKMLKSEVSICSIYLLQWVCFGITTQMLLESSWTAGPTHTPIPAGSICARNLWAHLAVNTVIASPLLGPGLKCSCCSIAAIAPSQGIQVLSLVKARG